MSTDDNKNTIVWKRSTQTSDDSQNGAGGSSQDTSSIKTNNKITFKRDTDDDTSVPALDLATQAAAYKKDTTVTSNESQSIDDLRAEIEAAFGGKEDPAAQKVVSKSDNVINLDGDVNTPSKNEAPLLPITPKATTSTVDAGEKESFMPPKAATASASIDTLISAEEKNALGSADTLAQDNHDALVASLKADIHSDFENAPADKKQEENTISSNTGIGQTYYSDLSTAMGANEPATMSELIKKSRFEKKEAAILSPKSKRNIMFISGAVVLLLASIAVIYTLFGAKEDPIEFVSEERVSSLVYADQDTGINVTGLESERTKQAIRTVIERKIPEDTINQIYYVEKTTNGAVRRLGVKDIFDKTDNQTPPLLYDNIENDFTHGVYRTDKNYPFIMLKALSYDRALEGMKEWEPTMLDDLATYFDLPPEATDRSLIQDGFEDDLIRNKNVRVSRFLPREVDGRGILDFLRLNRGSENTELTTQNQGTKVPTTQPQENLNVSTGVEVDQNGNTVEDQALEVSNEIAKALGNFYSYITGTFNQNSAYAQSSYQATGNVSDATGPIPSVNVLVVGTQIGAITDFDGNFVIPNVPSGNQQLQFSYVGFQTENRSISSAQSLVNVVLQESAEQLDEVVIVAQGNNSQNTTTSSNSPDVTGVGFGQQFNNQNGQRICYNIQKSCISRSTGLTVPYQQGDVSQLCTDVRLSNTPVPSTPALEGDTLNYSCVNTISDNDGNTIGGNEALSQLTTTEAVCFNNQSGARLQTPDASQFCFTPYRCNRLACELNGIEVPSTQQGQPGVVCGQETNELVSADSPLPKVCRQFNDILSYQNINESPVCFDNQSNYLKYKTPNDPQLGFNCILPQNRTNRLCITQQQKVVVRTGNEIFTTDQFCFEPNAQGTTNIGVNDQCSDLTTAQIQSRLAWGVLQLRLMAGIGSLFGLSNQDVGNINQAADYISDLSQGNILQVEAARQTALVLQNLEQILNRVDPNQQLPQTGPNGGLNLYGILREVIDTVKCTLGIANTLQWSSLAQIPQGITIYAGQSIPGVEPVQQALALIGLMDPVSVNGTLDLVTQDAISQFQLANALTVSGILDPETLALLETIIENQDTLYGDGNAIINDYFVYGDGAVDADGNIITGGSVDADGNIVTGGAAGGGLLSLGAYNNNVQNLQILLYAEGYEISNINGLFDEQTCAAVQQFQADNELEIADPISCSLGPDTIDALNDVIRTEGYLGSGFGLNPQGFLEGVGKLEGNFGPGVANFEVNEADADTLREGDIVLMYMFLDEQTILIARDQIVIDEIIQRRVLSDIFNN